jgi:hypothetical protein
MLRGGSTPYGPSKASAEALSAVMAADLEGTGVTTNVVIPGGIVNTPMIPWQAPFRREELLQPDVMLPSVYWLRSDDANAVTGRRFLDIWWDAAKPADVASQEAGAPIGWIDLAVEPVRPPIRAWFLSHGYICIWDVQACGLTPRSTGPPNCCAVGYPSPYARRRPVSASVGSEPGRS